MAYMFSGATMFNQPLDKLTTDNVTTMLHMFSEASNFNQNINSWSTNNVINMQSMFLSAKKFNNPLNNWKTSNVTNMINMFRETDEFNQNIGNWNVSNVTTMTSMFQSASMFNNGGSDSIKSWKAPKCTNFSSMFNGASRFNQPLPDLVDTSGVSSCILTSMFQSDTSFNQNVGDWNVSNVENMSNMFNGAFMFDNGSSDSIKSWKAPKCISFESMFRGTNASNLSHRFNQPLPDLVDTSNVTDVSMNAMFQNNRAFNQNIGRWNVSNVRNMSIMFLNASMFNNDASNSIQSWKAPKCTNFSSMFNGASRFNQPLLDLVDTSGVGSCVLTSMFQNDTSFNQNVGNWNVSNVTTMSSMFQNASMFNNGGFDSIKSWKAPNCTNFSSMFNGASRFNQPLLDLVDTSGVSSCILTYMFSEASLFNNGQTGTISIPNLIITNASYNNATRLLSCPSGSLLSSGLNISDILIIRGTNFVYSSDISTSIVSDTSLVLRRPYGANLNSGIISIEKQISGSEPIYWNTSNVTNMSSMFRNATSFNQHITTNGNIWNTSNVTDASYMFAGTSLPKITLFNNGEIISGITAPMAWILSSANISNFRTNCRLTDANKPSIVSQFQEESSPVE
jgi:surface protein